MDLLNDGSRPRKPSATNRPQKMGMWQCINNLGKALITSGYGLALILTVGFVGGSWCVFGGMDSIHKKEALLAIVGWPVIGLAGWAIAIVTIVTARQLMNFQARSYEARIQEIRQTKEEALTLQEKLPLERSGVTRNIEGQ